MSENAVEGKKILEGPNTHERRAMLKDHNLGTPSDIQAYKDQGFTISAWGYGIGVVLLGGTLLSYFKGSGQGNTAAAPSPPQPTAPPEPTAAERELQQKLEAERAARARAETAAAEARKRAAELAERQRLDALERERRDHSKIPDSNW